MKIAPPGRIRYPDAVSRSATSISSQLVENARRLARDASRLRFEDPVNHVYNPLKYAWAPHEMYLLKFGCGRKRILFLGMNPGPFGMMQTGVPFGEITAVRDWMKIEAPVQKPRKEHSVRKIDGFACARSEVSGRRLWALFADRFGAADNFFREHLVLNYCPLAFLAETGRNVTPDQLPARKGEALFRICDRHLARAVELTRPNWIIGIGKFAADRARSFADQFHLQLGQILHPSPASPAANRDWAGTATRQLIELCAWKPSSK